MKKFISSNLVIIIYIVLIVALVSSLYYIFNPNKTKYGQMFKVYYDALEYENDSIESNMNEITIKNSEWDWYKLKKTNVEDKKLINTYNSLVADIRTCYLLSTDIKNKIYDNLKVLNFKNKKSITKKQLLQLVNNKNCLENFNKYDSMVLSDNKQLSEKIKNQIDIITDYDIEVYNTEDSSNESILLLLVSDEAVKMSKISSLSKWLKIEYNTYKKY